MILMVDKNGQDFEVKPENFDKAIASGLESAFDMVTPEGEKVVVRKSNLDAATKKGLQHSIVAETKQSADNKYIRDEMKQMSPVEAGLRGVADAATFGQASKINAGLRSLAGQGNYDTLKQNYELSDEAAAITNPGSKFAGSQVPGLASLAAPVGGVKNALQSVGVGALEGGLRDESLQGALVGGTIGAIPLGVEGAKAAKGLIKSGASKAASVVSNLPTEVIDRYAAMKNAGRTAQPLTEIAKEAVGAAEAAGRNVSKGSGQAFDILKSEGVSVPRADAANLFLQKAQELKEGSILTPSTMKDITYLETLGKGLSSQPGEAIDGAKIKKLIQEIDQNAFGTAMKAGEITPANEATLRQLRGNLSDSLKSQSPAYAQQMQQVAKDVQSSQSLSQMFPDKEAAYRNLNQIGRNRAPFKQETLNELEGALGKNFTEAAKDSLAVDALKAPSINGSRNVNFYSNIPVIGPVLGLAADRLARPAVAKSIDYSVAIKKALENSPNLQKFGGVLVKAAQKGPQYLLLTHENLLKVSPEYKQAVGGQP